MSPTKLFIGIAAIITVALAAFVFLNRDAGPASVENLSPEKKIATTTPPIVYDTATPASDVTDEAFDADLAEIDAQMANLEADAANVDVGMNDTPIPQE